MNIKALKNGITVEILLFLNVSNFSPNIDPLELKSADNKNKKCLQNLPKYFNGMHYQ